MRVLFVMYVARKLWREYFATGVDGVVFIVDAVNRTRFPEARKELDVRITLFVFTIGLCWFQIDLLVGSFGRRRVGQCPFLGSWQQD
jgi:hypothetical protein